MDRNLRSDLRELLFEYGDYLQQHRGIAKENLGSHYLYLRRFLLQIVQINGIPIKEFCSQDITNYLTGALKPKSRDVKKSILTFLRGFLRYLFLSGHTKKDLSKAIPHICYYGQSFLPSFLTDEEVERLLEAPDRKCESGRRDHAMLLLMARYGVRLRSVKILKLKDIDWRKRTIHFPEMKSGKSVMVPMLPDVARALLEYIKKDRGESTLPEVFLTCRKRGTGGNRHAMHAFSHYNHMSQFKNYYIKAKIDSPQKASHILRHSFAVRLLKNGRTMKEIADLMGQRNIESTFVYTKVDIERLRSIAIEWPRGVGQ